MLTVVIAIGKAAASPWLLEGNDRSLVFYQHNVFTTARWTGRFNLLNAGRACGTR